MKQAENLANLRQLLAPKAGPFVSLGSENCDCRLGGGIESGALHEIFSADAGAATGFVLGLLSRLATDKPIFWIRQDFSALEQGEICASGLCAFGLDPAKIVIVRVSDVRMGLRACGEILASPGIGAVVFETTGETPRLDLAASRRLMLAAQMQGTNILLLRLHAVPAPSVAATRWRVHPSAGPSRFDAELIRNRHGGTGRWLMEWDNEQRLFCDAVSRSRAKQTAHSGAMAATAADRQIEASRIFSL